MKQPAGADLLKDAEDKGFRTFPCEQSGLAVLDDLSDDASELE